MFMELVHFRFPPAKKLVGNKRQPKEKERPCFCLWLSLYLCLFLSFCLCLERTVAGWFIIIIVAAQREQTFKQLLLLLPLQLLQPNSRRIGRAPGLTDRHYHGHFRFVEG